MEITTDQHDDMTDQHDDMVVSDGDDGDIVLSGEEVDVRLVRRAREVVRVSKRIVTEESTLTVTTRREELFVERRPATVSDQVEERRRPGSLEHVFTLSVEEVTIQTRIVPKERVRVWVEPTVEQRVVSADVGHEDVEVEVEVAPSIVPDLESGA
ncbi:MAG: YsnF/AvaK domain-containing protein [Actinomycetota bacterium]|nr:YsnF/AvaK domain-containing protein [Actinomycetota bacterium]